MKKIKLTIIVILVATVGWLSFLNLKPTRAYKEDFKGLKSPISEALDVTGVKILPQKHNSTSKKVLTMENDRIYFSVFLNDIFTEASFKIRFKNNKHQDFILRVPVNKGVEDAVKYYLEEKKLDELKNDSSVISIQDGSLLFLQKKDSIVIFPSAADFFSNPLDTIKNEAKIVKAGDYTFPFNIDLDNTQVLNSEKITSAEEFDYLFARYEPWQEKNGWKENQYEVTVPEEFRKKNIEFPFYLEAPGLEEGKNKIIIDSIEIILKKPKVTVSEKISNKLNSIFAPKIVKVK